MDDGSDDVFGGFGGEGDSPAIGDQAAGVEDDGLAVGGQCLDWLRHLERDQPVALQVHGEGAAAGEDHLAEFGGDDTVVAHGVACEDGIAALDRKSVV